MVAVLQMSLATRRRCCAEKADGAPCQAFVLRQSLFCQWHDPDRVVEREAAQARRVRQRASAPAPGWLLDLDIPEQRREYLVSVVRAPRDGHLSPEASKAVVYALEALERMQRRHRRVGHGGGRARR